jgi:hypothetical protein
MSPRIALVLVVAAAALPHAAHALDAGEPCTGTVTNAVDQHFMRKTAEVHGGPWAVVGAREVRLTCTATFGDATCGSPFLTLTSEPGQAVGVVAPFVFDFFDTGPALYVGSTVAWTDTEGSTFSRRVGCAMVYPGNEG